MRALMYILLIAAVLWTGFAWESVHAPLQVAVNSPQETDHVAEPEVPAAQTEEEVSTQALPAAQTGPLGVSTLPKPAPAPEPVQYTEEYVELLEQAVHHRINEERVREGLKTLKYDDTLAQVAAYHSTDMAENDYFAHEDDEGCDSACRVTSAGYKWRMVGENLFLLRRDQHFSVEGASAIVVAGWMGSPGHRKNMFEPDFTHQGIGVVILGDALYVTEVLTLPR